MAKKNNERKIIIMASGNGSNIEAIAKACSNGVLRAKIIKLISDNPGSYALKRAERRGISHHCHDFKSFLNRSDFNEKILQACLNLQPDFIVLAGYMKILPVDFVKHFKEKIINIHPSLLPKYPGTKAIKKAWNNKDEMTGVTVHYVDEGVDTGRVILQKRLNINYEKSFETLCEQVHALEHETYIEALQKIFST